MSDKMILRSIFVPQELDDELRDIAFLRKTSKAELMRSLIVEALGKAPVKDALKVGLAAQPVKSKPRSRKARAGVTEVLESGLQV